MSGSVILQETFGARASSVEALLQAADAHCRDSTALRSSAAAVDETTPYYQHTPTGAVYSAFAELLRVCAGLADWRSAVLTGEHEADRHLRAAKERLKLWLDEHRGRPGAAQLVAASESIGSLAALADVTAALRAVAAVPLPIGIYESEYRRRAPLGDYFRREEETRDPPPELAVAFLQFTVNGVPAAETHFIAPGQTHDLELEVRVSRWPAEAESLELRPISIEPDRSYDFPIFKLRQPLGEPPYILRSRGRAILHTPQSLHARPVEFRYSAHFLPNAAEQPVTVLGQRNLRIESIDLKAATLTGYPYMDAKVLELREQLRTRSLVSPDEIEAVLTLLGPVANYAGRLLQDNLIRNVWSEQRFQEALRDELRRRPEIGAALEEHPHAGGGIADLSFRKVRIELKSEGKRRLKLADCEAFVAQTVSYVVASGKRIGFLCVLDCSPKTEAPFSPDEGIGIFVQQTHGAPACIITVLLQANLARPSDLSRASRP